MDIRLSDTTTQVIPNNTIFVAPHLIQCVGQTDKRYWVSLFQQFRLNLQSRMAGLSDDRELHKLQGKLQYVDEMEQFFLKMITSPPTQK